LRAGAAGYVLKGATRQELLSTVTRALLGESVISSELANQLLRRLVRADQAGPAAIHLTAREHDVLRLVAAGRSNVEIADELFISVNTVKFHLRSIFRQLGIANRVQAAQRYAELTNGL
jgi:DNA-binding NarL/FixJ family response regulator